MLKDRLSGYKDYDVDDAKDFGRRGCFMLIKLLLNFYQSFNQFKDVIKIYKF